MSKILPLGAINKITREYVYPKVANKKDEYVCPDCNKDLTFCQGDIRAYHFRHKVVNGNPCCHYNSPTESQVHKDAKILLKNLLEKKISFSFIRKCCSCKIMEEYEIPEMTETSTIELEYRFQYNDRQQIADVAYLDNEQVVGLFELKYTHKTSSENRPEPWFEIDSEKLIQQANDNSLTTLQIPCIRCEKCDECIEKEQIQLKKIQINQKISELKKLLETIPSWAATNTEKNKKTKIRSKIRNLEEELSLLNNDKVTITKFTKEEKINDLKELLKNIDTRRANYRCNTNSDDDADTFRSMRYAKQDENYRMSLTQQLRLIENDVDYTLGNNVIVIEHPLTHIQLTRSLVNNKTRYRGKEWRTDISLGSIINWYKNSPDLFD